MPSVRSYSNDFIFIYQTCKKKSNTKFHKGSKEKEEVQLKKMDDRRQNVVLVTESRAMALLSSCPLLRRFVISHRQLIWIS